MSAMGNPQKSQNHNSSIEENEFDKEFSNFAFGQELEGKDDLSQKDYLDYQENYDLTEELQKKRASSSPQSYFESSPQVKDQPSYINSSDQKENSHEFFKQTPQFIDQEEFEINEDLKGNYSAPFRQRCQGGLTSKKE